MINNKQLTMNNEQVHPLGGRSADGTINNMKKKVYKCTAYSLKLRSREGFTLIELLVVMIILAALVFIASSSFIAAQMKARDAERKNDLKQIATALEAFYADYGNYPAADSQGRIIGCGSSGVLTACTPGNEFSITTTNGKALYMVQLPDDPRDGSYVYSSDGESYQLYARLENHRDPQVKNPQDDDPNNDDTGDVYGESYCGYKKKCNFGVSSTNVGLEPI